MTPLAEVFAGQSEPPALPGATAAPADVAAAAGMIGWLSSPEPDGRWIPLAVPA